MMVVRHGLEVTTPRVRQVSPDYKHGRVRTRTQTRLLDSLQDLHHVRNLRTTLYALVSFGSHTRSCNYSLRRWAYHRYCLHLE